MNYNKTARSDAMNYNNHDHYDDCAHHDVTEQVRTYTGGATQQRYAGGVTITERCAHCGATRATHANLAGRETHEWTEEQS